MQIHSIRGSGCRYMGNVDKTRWIQNFRYKQCRQSDFTSLLFDAQRLLLTLKCPNRKVDQKITLNQ